MLIYAVTIMAIKINYFFLIGLSYLFRLVFFNKVLLLDMQIYNQKHV